MHFIVCLHDVGTLDVTSVICAFKVETFQKKHFKTSVLEFQ